MRLPVHITKDRDGNLVFSRRLKSISKWAFCATAFLLGAISSTQAQVISPEQKGHYSAAFKEVRDHSKLKPGFTAFAYTHYGWTNTSKTNFNNQETENLISTFGVGDSLAVLNTKVTSSNFSPALYWTSYKEILGAHYVAGVMPSFYSGTRSTKLESEGFIDLTGYSETRYIKQPSVVDLDVVPVGLTWTREHYDFSALYGVSLPLTQLNEDHKVGRDFWSHRFQGFGYIYPNINRRAAFMMGLTYEINTGMKREGYNPGERFAFDWGMNYFFDYRLEGTIQGGHNFQVTDDKGSMVTEINEKHDYNTVAAGLAYWVIDRQLKIGGKYQFDYGENKRQVNQSIMFNVAFVSNPYGDNRLTRKNRNRYQKLLNKNKIIVSEL